MMVINGEEGLECEVHIDGVCLEHISKYLGWRSPEPDNLGQKGAYVESAATARLHVQLLEVDNRFFVYEEFLQSMKVERKMFRIQMVQPVTHTFLLSIYTDEIVEELNKSS